MKKAKRSHSGKVERSKRLLKTLKALVDWSSRQGYLVSAPALARATGTLSLHTDIYDLRQSGVGVVHKRGAKLDSGARPSYWYLEDLAAARDRLIDVLANNILAGSAE